MTAPALVWLAALAMLAGPPVTSSHGLGLLYAQNPAVSGLKAAPPERPDPLTKRIAVDFADVTLQNALVIIAAQSRLRLTYSSDDLPAGRHVSLSDADVSVGAALNVVLTNTGLRPIVTADGDVVLTSRRTRAVGGAPGDSSGTVAGVLVGRDDGLPVQYGTVLIVETGIARFTDASGHFRLTSIVPGTYTLRARQIGYAPVNATVHVEPAPAVSTITIVMTRLPPLLALVTVKGRHSKGCVATGIPDSAVDPRLAAIFAQVRENVDRYRLLVDRYPFRYRREETLVERREPGGDSIEFVDTASYESGARRRYEIGGIIYADSTQRIVPVNDSLVVRGASRSRLLRQPAAADTVNVSVRNVGVVDRRRLMYLPSFGDLADSAFLSTHCFAYGGTSSQDGTSERLIRVDFRPEASISAPDVEGSVYLDAQRYIVRRAVFDMTKPEAAEPPLLGLSVTTTFRELVPFVPVFDSVSSQQPLRDLFSMRGPVTRLLMEDDRILTFAFEAQSPGDQPAADSHGAPTRYDTLPSVVEGRAVRPDGTPVPGAIVGLMGGDSTITSDSGRFFIHSSTPGAHMLWIRGLGFAPQRLAVSLSPERTTRVTVTLLRAVPVLATITTTADERRAYEDIGLDQRMRGVGYFLTYDQIVRKQAKAFGDLLVGVPGLEVIRPPGGGGEWMVTSMRPPGCVSYVLDGKPLNVVEGFVVAGTPLRQLGPGSPIGTGIGAASPDGFIDAHDVGAMEYYEASERPNEFAGGRCALVVVWTRTRLGLPARDGAEVAPATGGPVTAKESPITSGTAAFPASSGRECQALTPTDTTSLNVYGILQSGLGPDARDTTWIRYADGVLTAFRQSFALPNPLRLPVFGYGAPALSKTNWKSPALAVAPTLSTVVAFTLSPTGALISFSVSATSLSGEADTSILAAVATAAAAHTFPSMPATGHQSINFDVIVTTAAPDSTQHAVVLDQIAVPEWPLTRPVALAAGSQPVLASGRASGAPPDSVTFEFVVDETGKAVMSTGRAISRTARVTDPSYLGFLARISQALPNYRFDPALVGRCQVPQVTSQLFID